MWTPANGIDEHEPSDLEFRDWVRNTNPSIARGTESMKRVVFILRPIKIKWSICNCQNIPYLIEWNVFDWVICCWNEVKIKFILRSKRILYTAAFRNMNKNRWAMNYAWDANLNFLEYIDDIARTFHLLLHAVFFWHTNCVCSRRIYSFQYNQCIFERWHDWRELYQLQISHSHHAQGITTTGQTFTQWTIISFTNLPPLCTHR